MIRNTTLGLTVVLTLAAGTACSAATDTHRVTTARSAGCDQIGNMKEATAPFYAPGNVYEAREVREKVFLARAIQPERTFGADLYLRAPKGVTKEYLQRALACHVARGEAAHPNDPLLPTSGRIAQLTVRSAGGSFAVKVVGEDSQSGREIWQRAQVFAAPSTTVEVEQVAGASDAVSTRTF